MEGKVPSTIDSRVSMLANAINSASENISATSLWAKPIDKLKSQLRQNLRSPYSKVSDAGSPKTSTPPRYPNPVVQTLPPQQQIPATKLVATTTATTSTSTINNESFIQDDAPWEDFRDHPQLLPSGHAATPPPRERKRTGSKLLIGVVPPPPPASSVKSTATSPTYPPQPLLSLPPTALEEEELLDNSIGTQTDKAALIPNATKPKSPKMKTKSLQIDFPTSGSLKTRTLFSRARSLTPTRYKTLKDEMKSQIKSTQNAVDGKSVPAKAGAKEELIGKGSVKAKDTKEKSRKVRRAQSLSPVNQRRKGRSKTHEHRERIIRTKSQTQLKEIAPSENRPKTIIIRENETLDKKKMPIKSSEKKDSNALKKVKNTQKKPPEKAEENTDDKTIDKKNEKAIAKKNEKKKSLKKKSTELKEKKVKKNDKAEEKNEGSKEKKDETAKEEEKDDPTGKTESSDKTEPDKEPGEKPEDQTVQDSTAPRKNPNGDIITTNPLSTTVADETIPEVDESHETPLAKGESEKKDLVEDPDAITPEPEKIVNAKKEKEMMIREEDNAEREVDLGNDRPPGDHELDEMELLLDQLGEDGEEVKEGLDPEMVKKTEEQIFTKIKFYKDVIDHVRTKPWTYRKKMKLLKEAKEYTARFEGKLSSGGGPGQIAQLKTAWAKTSRELSNYMALMIPWDGRIRHIESYFGSVVASYFTFLRWIFWTNIIQACIMGFAIIMPEIMFGPAWGTVEYKKIPENESSVAAYLQTAWDFEGYLKYSPLFYGYYSSMKKFESGYRMPLAYLIANLATFAYSFIAILRQVAANAKDEKASDKDDNFTFSWKAFASWDYMIGNAETAKNKFKSVLLGIRENITEQKEAKKKISKKRKALRVLANFCVLAVLASSTYAIILTVNRSREFEQRIKDKGPDSVNAWERNEISIVMSVVTSFFPILFEVIGNIEDYHPRIALKWALFRIMVLYLLNLYTLYIALYWKIMDIQKGVQEANVTYYEGFNLTNKILCSQLTTPLPLTTLYPLGNTTEEMLQSLSSTMSPRMSDNSSCIPDFIPETTCWETMVGQELFKLTVFDLVTTVAVIYASEFFRAILIKYLNACWCWDLEKHLPGYATFSLAENLLHLVYNQGMIWMGTLFTPGLPAFNLIKLLIMFYVRAWAVMVCNVPEERIFKAGSENFYLLLLLFMLYVVMIPIAFAMVSITPSPNCGPFREVQYMYLALTEWMQETFHPSAYSVISYTSSPGALIPIFVLLFLILNYLKSTNAALKGAVLDMKKQLSYERTEGKKKVFSMADTTKAAAKAAPTTEERSGKPGSGIIALKALSKMGALKNLGRTTSGTQSPRSLSGFSLNSNSGTLETQPAANNSTSLGGIMAATQFLARMRQRSAARAGVKLNPPPPGLNV